MRTLGGLLLLFAAGAIAWLWIRGYFSAGLARVAAAIQTPPTLVPLGKNPSGTVTALGTISNP